MYNPKTSHIASLAFAYGAPQTSAVIRHQPEDFCVDEFLSFAPSGAGEHLYVRIKKRNLTTEEAIAQVSKFANIQNKKIGYAGLKDRNAVTTQWLSLDLSGQLAPNWESYNSEQISILETIRHEKKLKRGAIKHNAFSIKLRNISGDFTNIEKRLNEIKQRGVPNYFAEQRFGRNEKNLFHAYNLLCENKKPKNRYLQGLYYSAARAYLFNLVLSHRVKLQLWDQSVVGDAMMLDGTRSFFVIDDVDASTIDRLVTFDIHPTGPLWGVGNSSACAAAQTLENQALADYEPWRHGLENHNLKQQRRALRLGVKELKWEISNCGEILLKFILPSGSYATSVLREIILDSTD